jgi:imidazoleglycerol-phosphate dehydratase
VKREASVERKTKETTVKVQWTIDGEGSYQISTGIPFFDHMLHLFAKHGFFDLSLDAKGDTDVDYHHTVEDIGITMGKSLKEALTNLEGIKRYGSSIIPMDESLCIFTVDMAGRPNLVWRADLQGKIGVFDTEVVKEFFKGFVNEAKITLHVNLLYGENLHHKVEAIFKAFGRALKEAVTKDELIKGPMSTKGVL